MEVYERRSSKQRKAYTNDVCNVGSWEVEAHIRPEPGDYVSNTHECSTVYISSNPPGKRFITSPSAFLHLPRLQMALYKWNTVQSDKSVKLDGLLTLQDARKLQDETNQQLLSNNQFTPKVLSGWMEKIKKRCELKFCRMQGESMDADQNATSSLWPRFCRAIMTLREQDVWNCTRSNCSLDLLSAGHCLRQENHVHVSRA